MDLFLDVLPFTVPLERPATLRPWEEVIADPTLLDPVQVIHEQEVSRLLGQILDSRLSPREAAVLRLRFGLNTESGEGQRRPVVATTLGLSAERVRQIEEHALSKLRSKPSLFRTLKSLM